LAVTEDILLEYVEVAYHIGGEYFPRHSPEPFLNWIHRKALRIEPAPLGRQRSRDPEDDMFLACAVAARARYVVTCDNDLLVLRKPFGVEIAPPREFLKKLPQS
jgi:putative PIN family toxin of toxin-antitoxin system